MQDIHQKTSFCSKSIRSYLNILKTSSDNSRMLENQPDREIMAVEKPMPPFVDSANYIAIKALEKIGLTDPDQKQIDVIETLISLAFHKEHFTPEKFDFCTGANSIARRVFLRHLAQNSGV